MERKEALLLILKELFGIFDRAESLYEYVYSNTLDDSTIDGLIGLFQSAIEGVANEEQKKLLQSMIQRLELMSQREQIDIKADQAAALRLLELIG